MYAKGTPLYYLAITTSMWEPKFQGNSFAIDILVNIGGLRASVKQSAKGGD